MAMSGRLSSKLSLISEVPLALFGGSGNYASALHIAAGKANAVEKVQAGYFNASSYRKLEVILTTNVEKLGKAGETVKVAPGYFRNHLMPKRFAVPNIEKYAHLIREQCKLQQPEEVERVVKVVPQTMEDKMKQYQAVAKRLDNARLVLRRQIRVNKESGTALYELQSPVTRDELVSEAARQLCVNIQPENLYLPEPFSTVGSFEVPLHLPKSIPLPEGKVRWTLDVKIRGK